MLTYATYTRMHPSSYLDYLSLQNKTCNSQTKSPLTFELSTLEKVQENERFDCEL